MCHVVQGLAAGTHSVPWRASAVDLGHTGTTRCYRTLFHSRPSNLWDWVQRLQGLCGLHMSAPRVLAVAMDVVRLSGALAACTRPYSVTVRV